MKVLLLEDVKGLGKKGQIVEAKQGYAQNFLIKNKLATEATAENVHNANVRQQAQVVKAQQLLAKAKEEAAALAQITVELKIKCGEGGRLYGAVTAQDLADALKLRGYNVDKRSISFKEPIKALGMHEAELKLHTEVAVTLKVSVIALGA